MLVTHTDFFKIEDFPQRYGIRIGGNHSFSPKIEEGRLCETSLTYLTFQNVKGFLYIYIYIQSIAYLGNINYSVLFC